MAEAAASASAQVAAEVEYQTELCESCADESNKPVSLIKGVTGFLVASQRFAKERLKFLDAHVIWEIDEGFKRSAFLDELVLALEYERRAAHATV